MKKIPVSWLKEKGIDPAPGDGACSSEFSSKWSSADDEHYQRDPAHYDNWFITSFTDRPNPGHQPVADWVPVFINLEPISYPANSVLITWSDVDDNNTYRPNFDALHDIYKKETAMQKPVHDPDQYLQKECPVESLALGMLPMAKFPHHKLEATPKPECYAQAVDRVKALEDAFNEITRESDYPACYDIACKQLDLSTATDNKPVFSQAMADKDEMPPIGVICVMAPSRPSGKGRSGYVAGDHVDLEVKIESIFISRTGVELAAWTSATGKLKGGVCSSVAFDAIKTDDEKLRDALSVISNLPNITSEIVGALLSSDKFTITLNKVGE